MTALQMTRSKKSQSRKQIIENLTKRFSKKRLCADDEIFYSMGNSGKIRNAPATGRKITAEDAFFLFTDKGIPTAKEDIIGWEEFKSYVIALRLLSITVGEWREEWKVMSTVERAAFRKEIQEDGFDVPVFMKDVWENPIDRNTEVCTCLTPRRE